MAPARRPRWGPGLLVALGLVVAGCGPAVRNGAHATGAASPARASGRPRSGASATPSPVPASTSAARCGSADLAIAVARGGVATGHVGAVIEFTNTGRTACTLSGWPALDAITARGRAVPAADSLSTFIPPVTVAAPAVVTLAPGGRAYAAFDGSNVSLNGGQCPPAYRSLRITPPGGTRVTVLPARLPGVGLNLPACSTIEVSPVVPASALP